MEINSLKEIVSKFIKCELSEINSETEISPAHIGGSILTARMYAEINKLGFNISQYWDIKTFGDLEKRIDKNYSDKTKSEDDLAEKTIAIRASKKNKELVLKENNFVGIDIENTINLPDTDDYWENEFYKSNFTKNEISYCSLKKNPKESFAGKFAAKEAIIKLINQPENIHFKDIEILNQDDGTPFFNDQISLSISHTKDYALAVAIKNIAEKKELVKDIIDNKNEIKITKPKKKIKFTSFFFILMAILINLLFYKNYIY